jgi:hypothetical protein
MRIVWEHEAKQQHYKRIRVVWGNNDTPSVGRAATSPVRMTSASPVFIMCMLGNNSDALKLESMDVVPVTDHSDVKEQNMMAFQYFSVFCCLAVMCLATSADDGPGSTPTITSATGGKVTVSV